MEKSRFTAGLCTFLVAILLVTSPTAVSIALAEKPTQPGSLIGSDPQPIINWEYDQVNPVAAYSQNSGLFLVVWEDHHWGWGDDWDIYGRMVNKQGIPVGDPFGISWSGPNHRLHPSVAYNSALNEFLVVYEYEFGATDHDIYAARVTSNGTLSSTDYVITNETKGETHPVVINDPHNLQYLVVWQRWEGDIEFGANDLYAQRLDNTSIKLGSQFAVRIHSTNENESEPTAAYFPTKDQFLVMWSDGVGQYPRLKKQWIQPNGSLGDYEQYFTVGANFLPRLAVNTNFYEYVYVYDDKTYDPTEISHGYFYLENSGAGFGSPAWWGHPGNTDNIDAAHNPGADNYVVVWEETTPNNHAIYRMLLDTYTPHYCCKEIGPDQISSTGANPRVASADGMVNLIIWEDYRNSAASGLDIYAMVVLSGWLYLPVVRK